MSLVSACKKNIETYSLLNHGDSVLVALSGGPDSVAVLYLLSKLQKKYALELSAVYVNHRIRPKAARQEEQFCIDLCDHLNVDLYLIDEDIPAMAKLRKTGLEETARNFRYGVFEALAGEYGFTKIALGHHVDDRVETILFRLIRGTGKTGLIGFQPKRDAYIRPLYSCTKKEILDYLEQEQLTYCVDRSNLKQQYSRNFIRHTLLPKIRARLNPNVDAALLNLADTINEEETYLRQFTEKHLKKMLTETPAGKLVMNKPMYAKLPRWERRRVLREMLLRLSSEGVYPDKEVVDSLDTHVIDGKKGKSAPDGIQVVTEATQVICYRKRKINFKYSLPPKGAVAVTELRSKLRIQHTDAGKVVINGQRRLKTAFFDKNKLAEPLFIRTILSGDRFVPLGMTGTKKIGDYLTDRKIPAVFRDEIPVLCDQKGIIWLVGFEIAERVKIGNKTKEVVKIDFLQPKRYQYEAV